MDTKIETTPRVYVACLSCYNAGRLVGGWQEAAEADAVSIYALHANNLTSARPDCEEMWCFDTCGLPLSRECSPTEAAEWGRMLAEVDEWQRDALLAWVRSGDYVMEGMGPMPSLPDFEEQYAGEWASFREYADSLADDLGMLVGIPDEVARYFDWDLWTRDLAYDYTTEPAPGGGVFVFRSL